MSAPPFIDAVHAAEVLHVPVDQVLDWVGQGRLHAMGGRPSNPFLRTAEVEVLALELGRENEEAPRRTKSAAARVQQRLTADVRWAEISDPDLREWYDRADPTRRAAARTVIREVSERLRRLAALLDQE